jgi:hypothetical protein
MSIKKENPVETGFDYHMKKTDVGIKNPELYMVSLV